MKDIYAKLILLFVDTLAIGLSIIIGYYTRVLFDTSFENAFHHSLSIYLFFPILYITILSMLAYENIYTKRYDFWQESRQVIKSLILSFIFIMAFLAATKMIYGYSRATIAISFFVMLFLLPTFKYFVKPLLYHQKLWQRNAYIYGKDHYLKEEIFTNPYLGYIETSKTHAQTIFIDSYEEEVDTLKNLMNEEMQKNNEVIFIPLINDYDLSRSFIYNLSKRRRNLIVYRNRLKSKYRLWIKQIIDILMAIIIFPLLSPLLLFIAYKIRKEEPHSSMLFTQERLGQNGKIFTCYKFRTMFEKSDTLLKSYLEEHPEEIDFYSTYHKYKNDPRITKIGDILRRTSLDELPQIFNVFKNEMSFIGPRPYMLNEKEKMGNNISTILTVKPGITGLWQVSGRSEIDFRSRVALDVWYIRNWNLWLDISILFQTIKTVLSKKGAS